MKLLISANGSDLDALIGPTFARSPWFLMVDTDTMEYRALENVRAGDPECSAITVADMLMETLAGEQLACVLTGDMGPNASRIFWQAGIPVTTGLAGVVKEVVAAFASKTIKPFPVRAPDTLRAFIENRRILAVQSTAGRRPGPVRSHIPGPH
jgi:predicted Fe-Mo cluster-binding NifX family protein